MKQHITISRIFAVGLLAVIAVLYFLIEWTLSMSDERWCREFTTCEDADCCADALRYRGDNRK